MSGGAVARYIEQFEKQGNLRGSDIANFTGVSKATVSRWRSGTASPNPTNERIISDLHYVMDRLSDFYTPAEIRTWLYAPHPQLEGRRAIDVIHDGKMTEVLQTLDRLEAGVYL
jgi:putative toxin-antitoxin system antitoxin component (TIGR02293 family)